MSKPIPGKQYTIQDENTLSQVARRAYGNGNHWPKIWQANQTVLRSGDPNLIYPGEVIFIPELAEFQKDTSQTDRAPDELSIVIDGYEIRSTDSKVMLTMDTGADGWTATIAWTPGEDPDLDKRITPFSYAPTQVYIGGELKISGFLYITSPSLSSNGRTMELEGFSKTADIIDSNLRPPYEESNVTLVQRAKKLIEPHGIKLVIDADGIDGAFERVTASEDDKIFEHILKLTRERGALLSCTPQGNLLITQAKTKGAPVATIEEGGAITEDFRASFNGRARYNVYRAIKQSPFGSNEAIAKDDGVPKSRILTFSVTESLDGEIQKAADWKKNKTLADAFTIDLPVAGWLNPRTGKPWEVNTIITVISKTLFVPKGFNFIIRRIEFEEKENMKRATLGIIPPSFYTKEKINEPWK